MSAMIHRGPGCVKSTLYASVLNSSSLYAHLPSLSTKGLASIDSPHQNPTPALGTSLEPVVKSHIVNVDDFLVWP